MVLVFLKLASLLCIGPKWTCRAMPQMFHSVMKKKETKRITPMFAKNSMNSRVVSSVAGCYLHYKLGSL